MPKLASEAEELRYAELQQMALDFARQDEVEPLREMLRHGLPLNLADVKGNSLVMLAAYHGNASALRMLLESGADSNRRNDRGQTPLGGAAFKGYEEIVTLLLDLGAEIDADNGGGMTPLMYAAMFGRTQVVSLLRARGASGRQRNRLGLSAKWMVSGFRVLYRLIGRRS